MSFCCACSAEIGDECSYDDDCSTRDDDDRYCDRTQPGGYCLIIGCSSDGCPKESSCVEFTSPCPDGEDYDDGEKCSIIETNRTRTYCLQHCKKNSDCRSKYQCVEPETFSGEIIDYSSNRTKVCVPE
jgi:hypothetical protein